MPGVTQLRNMFSYRKLVSKQYPVTGVSAAGGPATIPIELRQYAQQDTFDRLLIRVQGNLVVAATGGGGTGTATGLDNPEGLLLNVALQTQPQVFGVQPFNNLTGRGLREVAAFDRGYYINPTALVDTAGTQAVDYEYELIFKRAKVRNNIEWGLPTQNFSSLLLNLTFGGRTTLFTGGAGNTWDMSGLTVEVWADSDFAVNPGQIHAVENFETTYPIPNTQTDFPIDTLPSGYMYTDLTFMAEVSGVLTNGVILNVNLEGGGRIWTPQGDGNAPFLQRANTTRNFSDAAAPTTGIYSLPIRDGMFSRSIDALNAPVTVRVNVVGNAANVIRLVGTRIIPGGIKQAQPKKTS